MTHFVKKKDYYFNSFDLQEFRIDNVPHACADILEDIANSYLDIADMIRERYSLKE